jgi:hypothetical protein
MTARQFICIKWGTKYPSAEVNRLFRGLQRVAAGPFVLHCVTDDIAGIDPAVSTYSIPDLPFIGNTVMNHGWRKLALFAPELRSKLSGPTIYLDLDVVLLKPLDEFFLPDTPFCVIKDYKRLRCRNFAAGNTSLFLYQADRDYGVYERLAAMGREVQQRFRNEQEFLTDVMQHQGLLRYWPRSWCVSYKYHCVPTFPLSLWREPGAPRGAYVLVFHGSPKLEDALRGMGAKWYRPMLPAPWLERYLS